MNKKEFKVVKVTCSVIGEVQNYEVLISTASEEIARYGVRVYSKAYYKNRWVNVRLFTPEEWDKLITTENVMTDNDNLKEILEVEMLYYSKKRDVKRKL